jgi:ankyrin repeat protein
MLNPLLYRRHIKNDAPLDSCLLWAAQHGRLDTIRIAHQHGANLNTNGARTEEDYFTNFDLLPGRLKFFATPLHIAVHNDHRDIVEYLLDNGANVHVPSRHFIDGVCRGYPLHIALERPTDDAAVMLIQHGAYLITDDVSALPTLIKRGRHDLVELLLDNCSEVTASDALHIAAGMGDRGLIQRLLKRDDLDVSSRISAYQTPLHLAALKGNVDFVKALFAQPEVHAGAVDLEKIGMTALHHEASSGHLPIAERDGSEINSSEANNEGSTPLYGADGKVGITTLLRLLERPERRR